MTKNVILRITCFVSLMAFSLFFLLKTGLFDDIFYKPKKNIKFTLAQSIQGVSKVSSLQLKSVILNDASALSETKVAAVFQPTSINEIRLLIKTAIETGHKISMSGARHSLGGQNLYSNSIHLNLNNYDKVQYNTNHSVTCESGATWKQIQEIIGKNGRAIAIMQDSNIFSIGGSLSLNVHGKDPRFSALIESINWFKLLLANGEEIICSREENPELFKSVIGGMGLFGVITEINLKTVPNEAYSSHFLNVPATEMISLLEKLTKSPQIELLEAQMSIDNAHLLNESQIYYYKKTERKIPPKDVLDGENSIWLRRIIYKVSRSSDLGKSFRWFIQKRINHLLEPKILSRNTAMADPVRMLQLQDNNSTDILQEYFIPTEKTQEFLKVYKKLLQKHKIKIVNLTVRKEKKNTEAVLSYAPNGAYAFVSYYTISKTISGNKQMTSFTKELVNYLNQIGGKTYLAYNPYCNKEQIIKMYPNLNQLFVLKKKYDPSSLFMNAWYEALVT